MTKKEDMGASADVFAAVHDADERMASFVAALADAGSYDARRELWLQAIEDSQLERDLRTLFGTSRALPDDPAREPGGMG